MKRKICVRSMFLGAVIMLIGLSVGAIVSPPLIAQRNGVFDEITCRAIEVVDEMGQKRIVMRTIPFGGEVGVFGNEGRIVMNTTIGGEVGVWGKHGRTIMSAGILGGDVRVFGNEGKRTVMDATEDGGGVTVYDKEWNVMAGMSTEGGGGSVDVFGKDGGRAVMTTIDHSGVVKVYSKGGEARMTTDEQGGRVEVLGPITGFSEDGNLFTRKTTAAMFTGEHGGRVDVGNKEGKRRVTMGTDEQGGIVEIANNQGKKRQVITPDIEAQSNGVFDKITCREIEVIDKDSETATLVLGGAISVLGKNDEFVFIRGGRVEVLRVGSGSTQMYIDEHGGRVEVYNNQGKNRAAMGVNAFGNGGVSTWDKNGYRQ